MGTVLGSSAGVLVSVLAGPVAAFLYEGLLWSAFFLPAYLWTAAIIVFLPGFRRDLLFVLLASLAPFAVVAYFARVLDAALVESLVSGSISLANLLSLALLGTLTLALCVLILALRVRLFGMTDPGYVSADQDETADSASKHSAPAFVQVDTPGLEEVLFADSEPAAGAASEIGDLANGFRMPPVPPALNLSSLEHPNPKTESLEDEAELLVEEAEPIVEKAELLSETAGSLSEIAELLPERAESLSEAADLLPLEDEPIPVLFGRRTEEENQLGAISGTVSDPAMDADFWDEPDTAMDGITSQEVHSGRGALLPKVEVWADGTHTEALREAEERKPSGKSLPGLPRPALKRLAKPLVPYTLPTDGILTAYPDGQYWIIDEKTRHAGEVLKETLKEFNIEAEVTGIRKGPVITMFEILPAPGVRLSKIATLSDNIALRLAASSVRIVAPIPGKHAVGIEVPNERRAIVSFKEIVESEVFKSAKMEVPVVLGKDISGDVQVVELTQTPHLLIAGATGSGKSVCVNSIILSILYKRSFNEVKLILIDPKIVELKLYNGIPHLLTPVITEPKKAFQALQYCICEMERRYSLLDAMGVRDIRSYNRKIAEKNMATDRLPYIVVIIDEFADLMATTGKELESTLARLAAMSRAVGIHLVLATQRPDRKSVV